MRAVLLFAGAFAIAWLPYLVWKLAYYGDWLPNTYYAKSADLAWWAQGWTYVRLYLARYWIAALAVPVGLVAIGASWRRGGDAPLALALAMALVYTTFVARAGGDFMYARLLIPVTPLPLIALERGIATLVRGAAAARWAFAGIAIAAMALTPVPLRGTEERSGIVNEPLIYTREALARTRREGSILRRYFAGLPVSVAYCGSQAALMYYSRPAVAIESEAGLTDAHIAHQRLAGRGRVGHEKQAPVPYLLDRRVNFVIHRFPSTTLHLDDWLPLVSVGFDTVPARIVHWDAPLLAEMRRRGADFLDVPSSLDKFIAGMDTLPDDDVRQDYVLVKRFYFDFVSDPAREEMFRRRLARARPS